MTLGFVEFIYIFFLQLLSTHKRYVQQYALPTNAVKNENLDGFPCLSCIVVAYDLVLRFSR